MAESAWTKVVSGDELAEGKTFVAKLNNQEIMLLRAGDRIFACGNKCTHYGGPLNEGLIVGTEVICPWHNARFDMATGDKTASPGLGPVAAYDTKEENGSVFVRERPAAAHRRPSTGSHGTILILGGGAAGDAAAEALRNGGYAGRVLLITQEKDLPYDRTVLSKGFLTGETKPEWVSLREDGFYEKQGIEIWTERRIIGFDPQTRRAALDNGESLEGDKVLLATGSVPRRLPLPGSDLEGCFYLRSLADGRRLAEAAKKAQHAVVLGASFIGLETASGLVERKIDVHVAAPERIPLETVFGAQVGRRILRLHEEHGIHFHLQTTAVRIDGNKRVEAVLLADGTQLEADLVVIGAGVVPAVEYLAKSDLLVSGAVPVNERLETKYPGVFAAGDIAIVPDILNGGRVRIEHWVVAQRHGLHAAKAMLGAVEPYAEPPFFWTMQYGNSIKYSGYARGFDEIAFRGEVETGPFSAGYFQDGMLRAVSTIGRGRDVLIAGELLKERIKVSASQYRDTADLETLLPR